MMRDIIFVLLIAVLIIAFFTSKSDTDKTKKQMKHVVKLHNRNVLVGINDKDYSINDDLNKDERFFVMNNTGKLPDDRLELHYRKHAKQEDFYF